MVVTFPAELIKIYETCKLFNKHLLSTCSVPSFMLDMGMRDEAIKSSWASGPEVQYSFTIVIIVWVSQKQARFKSQHPCGKHISFTITFENP